MKNNNLIAAGVLIAGLAVAYYFLFFLPNLEQSKEYDIKVASCYKQAQEALGVSQASSKEFGLGGTESVTNHFNKKDNRCYAEISSLYRDSSGDSIVDAYENTSIVDCFTMFSRTGQDSTTCTDYRTYIHGKEITEDQFDVAIKELMTN